MEIFSLPESQNRARTELPVALLTVVVILGGGLSVLLMATGAQEIAIGTGVLSLALIAMLWSWRKRLRAEHQRSRDETKGREIELDATELRFARYLVARGPLSQGPYVRIPWRELAEWEVIDAQGRSPARYRLKLRSGTVYLIHRPDVLPVELELFRKAEAELQRNGWEAGRRIDSPEAQAERRTRAKLLSIVTAICGLSYLGSSLGLLFRPPLLYWPAALTIAFYAALLGLPLAFTARKLKALSGRFDWTVYVAASALVGTLLVYANSFGDSSPPHEAEGAVIGSYIKAHKNSRSYYLELAPIEDKGIYLSRFGTLDVRVSQEQFSAKRVRLRWREGFLRLPWLEAYLAD